MTLPVRILQVLADGAPGGGSTAVLGLSSDLRDRGFLVTLVTAPGSATAAKAERIGITVRPFDFFTSRFDFRIPGRLAPIVAEARPDLIHVHGGRSAHPFCSPPLSGLPAPLVYTVHGFHFLKQPLLRRILGREAERRIARRADRIVFVSEADRRIALDHRFIDPTAGKDEVIVNGIDPADFTGLTPLDGQADLLFLGRLHPQKNPLFMVDVMAALGGDATLLVAGGGELEEPMKAKVAAAGLDRRIFFAGALPRGEALRALLSAKLFVLPSLWEGLPIAPIESLWCRLPVVASRISGTDEVVADGVDGALIEGFDARRWAATIGRLLDDEALRRRYGEAGRAKVAANFLRSRNTERTIALYDGLLGRGAVAPAPARRDNAA